MPKLRNITPDDRMVGDPREGIPVAANGELEVFGDVEEIDDAYLVTGGEVVVGTTEDEQGRVSLVKERQVIAWPKSIWQLVGSKSKSDDGGSSK